MVKFISMKPKHIELKSPAQAISVNHYKHDCFQLPLHVHSCCELTWIIKGRGTRFVGDAFDPFAENDLVLLGPKTPHAWKSDHSIMSVESISIQFKMDFAGQGIWDLIEMRPIQRLLKNAQRGVEFMGINNQILFHKIQNIQNKSGAKQIISLLSMLEILADLPNQRVLSRSGYGSNLQSERAQLIFHYILNNLHNNITLPQLAKIANMHPVSVGRFVKKHTGRPVNIYINELRIKNACTELIMSDKTIGEICYESGFQNLSNFNRQFKLINHMTPREYRTKYKSS